MDIQTDTSYTHGIQRKDTSTAALFVKAYAAGFSDQQASQQTTDTITKTTMHCTRA